jgi:hypothetical protein
VRVKRERQRRRGSEGGAFGDTQQLVHRATLVANRLCRTALVRTVVAQTHASELCVKCTLPPHPHESVNYTLR